VVATRADDGAGVFSLRRDRECGTLDRRGWRATLRMGELMKDGLPGGRNPEDFHELDAAGVEAAAAGFIEQEEIRDVDENAGEGDALLHARERHIDEIVLAASHVGKREGRRR